MKVKCDNCSWQGDEGKAGQAEDIEDRHAVGVLYSDLECPKCESLCYPVDQTQMYPYSLFVRCRSIEEQQIAERAIEGYRAEATAQLAPQGRAS